MPSRTPYTDFLHTNGVLITRHPLPEGDAHPFDSPFTTPLNANREADDIESREDAREVLMPVEDVERVLYLDEDDIADGDESQEWQVSQTQRGVNAW